MSDRRREEREVVMRVLSLFSGAGGSDLALEAAGFEVAALCEIEPHARAVLREHWPDVPLHGDICALDGTAYRGVDVVVGGSPCQDLSVAGKRAGLVEGSGTRSSLFFEQVRVWNETEAPYLIWENVYGALSSNAGADFAAVLSALVGATLPVPRDGWERGGVASGRTAVAAWRVLDLQHFGVPQRRERVVVLAARAGGVDPAEVLALGDSLSWDSPPRYAQRESTTLIASGRAGVGGTLGSTKGNGGPAGDDTDRMTFVAQEVSPPVTAKWAKGSGGPAGDEVQNLVVAASVYPCLRPNTYDNSDPLYEAAMQVIQPIAHTLRGEGCDAREDGTGRGTPMVIAFHQKQNPISDEYVSPALGATSNGMGVVAALAENQRGELRLTDIAPQLTVGGGKPGQGYPAVIAPCLRVGGRDQDAGDSHGNTPVTVQGLGVRMLTPLECERIMGWPDSWTRYGVNEKGVRYELKDTPRYRLCGNGQAREWGEWIYLRLADAERRASEGLTYRRRAVVAA